MIGELAELVDWLRAATAGWRFLLSAEYRSKVIRGWKRKSRFVVVFEIICGLAGTAFSVLAVVGIIALIRWAINSA